MRRRSRAGGQSAEGRVGNLRVSTEHRHPVADEREREREKRPPFERDCEAIAKGEGPERNR